MKKDLSSVEIKYLVEEFKVLEGKRIGKIYSIEDDILLQTQGGHILTITPNFAYLATEKPITEKITGFCAFLRKHLTQAKIKAIEQLGTERTIKITTDRGDVYVELYVKGNIIVAQDGKVLQSKNPVKDFPPSSENKVERPIIPGKEPISKTLATQQGLGKTYAAEACLMAGIDPKAETSNKDEIQKLTKAKDAILCKKLKPVLVKENGIIIDATPFPLKQYEHYINEETKTYSQAIEIMIGNRPTPEEERYAREKLKIENAMTQQKAHITELEKEIEENRKKAETIYEKYTELKELLERIKAKKETKYVVKEGKVEIEL